MFLAQLTFRDVPDRRAVPRWPVALPGHIVDARGAPLEVTVRDLSSDGFLVDADLDLPVGSVISIRTAGTTLDDARVVRQVFAQYGCEFVSTGDPLGPPPPRVA